MMQAVRPSRRLLLLFSSQRVPIVTRLGRAKRDVLDTLIQGSSVRNRSQVVNWAIQAFACSRRDWLRELREAVNNLSSIREQVICNELWEERNRLSLTVPMGRRLYVALS